MQRRKENSRLEVIQSVQLAAESDVALFVEPDGERVPVSDQKPLADIELSVVDEQRSFYVPLDHQLTFSDPDQRRYHLEDLVQVLVARDAWIET